MRSPPHVFSQAIRQAWTLILVKVMLGGPLRQAAKDLPLACGLPSTGNRPPSAKCRDTVPETSLETGLTMTVSHRWACLARGPAGQLLVTAGDKPGRMRSEPSFARICGVAPIPLPSGRTDRHRLHSSRDAMPAVDIWSSRALSSDGRGVGGSDGGLSGAHVLTRVVPFVR